MLFGFIKACWSRELGYRLELPCHGVSLKSDATGLVLHAQPCTLEPCVQVHVHYPFALILSEHAPTIPSEVRLKIETLTTV
jgi:hypothetical protein